jgi:hypothetical protein
MTAVPSIEQLSRAELVELVTLLANPFTPRDIALARWLAASNAWEQAARRLEPLRAARDAAWDTRNAKPFSLKARMRFDVTETAVMRAELAASRLWSHRCRLYAVHSALEIEDAA